jgi:hypothetical protein
MNLSTRKFFVLYSRQKILSGAAGKIQINSDVNVPLNIGLQTNRQMTVGR